MGLEKALKFFNFRKNNLFLSKQCSIHYYTSHLFLYNLHNFSSQKFHELIQYSDFSQAENTKSA